jgi:hypothetical protein
MSSSISLSVFSQIVSARKSPSMLLEETFPPGDFLRKTHKKPIALFVAFPSISL